MLAELIRRLILYQDIKAFNTYKLELMKYQNMVKSHIKLNLECLGLSGISTQNNNT